jgi:hypothetical protein
MLAIALYTSPRGNVQQTYMERYAARVGNPLPPHEKVEGDLLILPISYAELVDAMRPATPNTVLVNGKKIAASRFIVIRYTASNKASGERGYDGSTSISRARAASTVSLHLPSSGMGPRLCVHVPEWTR